MKAAVDTAVKEFGRLDVMVLSIPYIYHNHRDAEYINQFNNAGKFISRPLSVHS